MIAFERYLNFTAEGETKPTVDVIQNALLGKYGNYDAELTLNRGITFVWYKDIPELHKGETKIYLINKYASDALSMHGGSITNALSIPDTLEGIVLLASIDFDQNNLANSLHYKLVNFSQTKALAKGLIELVTNGEKEIIDEKIKAGSKTKPNL